VIERCRRQLNFADGLIAEEVDELWEDWMRQVDQVLGDRSCWKWSTRRWRRAGPRVARAGAGAHRRRWCCACCC